MKLSKIFIALALSLSVQSSYANSFTATPMVSMESMNLPTEATGLYNITELKLVDLQQVKELAKTEDGQSVEVTNTYATINATLNGCSDQLGPIYINVQAGKRLFISINAMGIARLSSQEMMCLIAPVQTIKINLGQIGKYSKAKATLVMPSSFLVIGPTLF